MTTNVVDTLYIIKASVFFYNSLMLVILYVDNILLIYMQRIIRASKYHINKHIFDILMLRVHCLCEMARPPVEITGNNVAHI